ncbi:hypothetical protein BDR05DRAFT_1003120 [Suillus weaverae]|nr:hypothetical protein BDR05DRAFT_1003120 [Suillus weaverae]
MSVPKTAPSRLHAPIVQPAVVQPAATQQQPLPPADEITALRARVAELEQGGAHGNHPLARVPTPQQALVADPEAVNHIRANLAGTKDDLKRPMLPALRPGNKDGLTAKGLDRSNELSIVTVDWVAAARVAEERMAHYWGEDHAAALASHHLVVLNIRRTHGWSVAMHYDVQQRELVHANHEHNLAGLNVAALTIANIKISAITLHWQENLLQPSRPMLEANMLSQTRPESITALTGPTTPVAPSVPTVEMFIHVVSVVTCPTGLAAAESGVDPHTVVTPLDHLKVEDTLRKYGIFNDWCHIVNGIHDGFNIGILTPPKSTLLF